MPWTKTPPEIVAAFDRAVPADPRVVRRPMFGYPALYVNGNMFAGTYQDQVVVRLGETDRARLVRAGGTPFEPMAGRPMKEYLVVPRSTVSTPAALRAWIERGLAHAAALPAKTTAKAAKTTTTKAARRGAR